MDLQHYVQSFSHGQITIPKQFRDKLGLNGKFWLRMYLDGNKLISEPSQPTFNKAEYLQKLAKMKGDWFNVKEWKKIRKEINGRFQRYDSA